MPTYPYKCASCGFEFEQSCSFKDYVPRLQCGCGGWADRTWCVVEVIAKGTPRDFKLDITDQPIGWHRGNTSEAQEARYEKIVRASKQAALANDSQACKNGMRMIARVPRELDRARRKQFGKDYWDTSDTKQIKANLASDGLLFKN